MEGVRATEDGRGDAGIETGSVRVVAPPVTGTDLAFDRARGHAARFGLVRADHAVQARIAERGALGPRDTARRILAAGGAPGRVSCGT